MRLNHVYCAIVNSIYGTLYLLWAVGFLIIVILLAIFEPKDGPD